MSLLGWIAAGIAAAAVAAVVISVLCADEIINWFQSRLSSRTVNSTRVGITVLQHLNNGHYQVVQGIFNTVTEEVVERRIIEAERIDPALRNAHDQNGVAVWT